MARVILFAIFAPYLSLIFLSFAAMKYYSPLIFLTYLLFLIPCFAQKKEEAKWDVQKPNTPTKELNFSTQSGTWMNLDVHPDGKTIAFDLLGDIYTLPIGGGAATCIAQGMAYEVQPRFSPDGKRILFTSDRAGGDNIWYMDVDGGNKKQITKEDFRLMNNGVWTPDGNYIIARKHFTSGRSLGAGEMWMYHINGSSGIQLTKKRNDQMDAGEPCLSPDGKFLYYSEDASPGRSFEYNKDVNGQIYVIQKYNRETGETERVVGGAGGACRPQISPDGKYLAYIKRIRFQSKLFIHELSTGRDFEVFDKLSRDQQETWAIFGVYPNFNWLPTSKELVIYGQGKLWRISLAISDKEITLANASAIPFTVNVKQTITPALNFKQEPFKASFEAKMIRHADTSPDGKKVAFVSNGAIYEHDFAAATNTPFTQKQSAFQFEPKYSQNGRYLVYTSWDDIEKGAIWLIDLQGTVRTPQKLTQEPGFYHTPSFGDQDRKIVYYKGSGNSILGYAYGKNEGIYMMDIDGKNPERLSKEGEKPILSPDGKYLYFTVEGDNKQFKVQDMQTRKTQTLCSSKYAMDFLPSPDGKWLAFRELYQAYIIAFPPIGQTLDISGDMKSLPIFKLTRDAGTCLHWSRDSKKLNWLLGQQYFSREISKSFSWVEGGKEQLPPIDTTGIPLHLSLTSDAPNTQILLTHARIITMEGDKVMEDGNILIHKNYIQSISESPIATDATTQVIDCTGKTIIPGLIDVHAHLGASYNGISPQNQWSYLANLAFGVTTTHDPSNDTEMVFSQAEMVETGRMVGPRIFSTGTILYGADGDFKAVINSLEDAQAHLRRMKAVGAFSVKSYNQPRREQRQQVLQAARELHMNVYPEGGSTFFYNMSHVMDGHTGVEHSIPISDIYEDVKKFWGGTKVGYTPTLIVAYGGIWGENYWYDKTNVWENKRLLQFTPRSIIDERSRRRIKAPDEEYGHMQNTAACTELTKQGVKVNLGAHGQLQGLGAHWELWMLKQGGMSALEALRCGTQNGADYLGMGHALGSISKGKLADLIILDKNPLDDIQHSDDIHLVIKNGVPYRLEERATKGEIPFWWLERGAQDNCESIQHMHSTEKGHCSCGAH